MLQNNNSRPKLPTNDYLIPVAELVETNTAVDVIWKQKVILTYWLFCDKVTDIISSPTNWLNRTKE